MKIHLDKNSIHLAFVGFLVLYVGLLVVMVYSGGKIEISTSIFDLIWETTAQ